MNLLKSIKIRTNYACTGIASPDSTFLDMSDWDGCLFLVAKGSSNISSSGTLIVQQATGTSTAGAWASTFSNAVHFTTGENEIGVVDVVRPLRRYLRLHALTCTGVVITAIQYRGRRLGSTEAEVNLETWSGTYVCTS